MQDKGGRRRRGGLPFCCVNGFCDYVLCHYCCAIKGAKTQVANLVASFLVATVMHGCLFAHMFLQCFRGRCGGHPGLSIKVTTQLKTWVNSWEHRKTSKIIWYRPENNWGFIIDNLSSLKRISIFGKHHPKTVRKQSENSRKTAENIGKHLKSSDIILRITKGTCQKRFSGFCPLRGFPPPLPP